MTIETANPRVIAQYLNDLLAIISNDILEMSEEYELDAWKELYNFVFSEEISKKIHERFPDFHYADPDTTYQEDVITFINAFSEYAGFGIKKKAGPRILPSFEDWCSEMKIN